MSNDLIIITAIGSQDRPGIIASLTGAVLEEGGNLDDATMTRLHGAFATMIAARLQPDKLASLRLRLDTVSKEMGLHISLENLDGDTDQTASTDTPDHIITVYGADHPGIVHHVAKLLQSAGTNITDLKTRLTGDSSGKSSLYVMMVETSGGDWDTLPNSLLAFGKEQNVDVSFSALDEETL